MMGNEMPCIFPHSDSRPGTSPNARDIYWRLGNLRNTERGAETSGLPLLQSDMQEYIDWVYSSHDRSIMHTKCPANCKCRRGPRWIQSS